MNLQELFVQPNIDEQYVDIRMLTFSVSTF